MTRAAILTIGTEVSAGEILNSNAQWLAQRAADLRFEVVTHLVVPDEESLMLKAMDWCAAHADLLLITGGLGPTRDDFTRDVVAKWVDSPLVFDSASWDRIVERLTSMGVAVAEANRQQCYFPQGARIVKNPEGTANAFCMEVRGKALVCLPGPPPEIQAIWQQDTLSDFLKAKAPENQRLKLWYWHCIGLSESRLGEIVESALEGSGFQTGYRPHVPYVDVKVWTPYNTNDDDHFLLKLDAAIAEWTVAKQGQDVAQMAIDALKRRGGTNAIRLVVSDPITGGFLAKRLGEAWQRNADLDQKSCLSVQTEIGCGLESEKKFEDTWEILLTRNSTIENCWSVRIRSPNNETWEKSSNFSRKINAQNINRFRAYVAELTLCEVITLVRV